MWSSVSSLRPDDQSEQPPEIAGTGSFVVGSDIVFGAYLSDGAEADSRWEINVSGSALQRRRGSGDVEATLDRRWPLFRTADCETWKWVGEQSARLPLPWRRGASIESSLHLSEDEVDLSIYPAKLNAVQVQQSGPFRLDLVAIHERGVEACKFVDLVVAAVASDASITTRGAHLVNHQVVRRLSTQYDVSLGEG